LLNWHLAASLKSVVLAGESAALTRAVATIANAPAIREALQSFAREKRRTTDQQLQLCRVPAPTFFEQKRAEWVLAQFRALGTVARIDRAGNVIAHPSGYGARTAQ